MDTRFIESFITVIESGSMAEAARRLNLTPAAVAQRIHALEAEIGAKLVARSGRTVRSTEAGAKILARAREFLNGVRELKAAAIDDVLVGELRLGAVSTALTGLLPPLLAGLADRYPRIGVYIEPGVSRLLFHKVLEGELDAAMIVEPQFALPKTVDWTVLREEPLILLAPASMAAMPMHELLRNQPFIRYDRNNWGGRLADRYLRAHDIEPRERFELDALDAIAVLVDRRLGVSLVPDWAAPWPEGLSIAKIALPGDAPARRLGLLWAKMSSQSRPIAALLQVMRERGAALDRTA